MSDPYEALSAMLTVARGEQWYAAPEGSPAREAYALAFAALSGKPEEKNAQAKEVVWRSEEEVKKIRKTSKKGK